MIGSCKTCKKRLNITKFDYSQGGCKHIKLDGYACLAFAGEREVVWMVGVNEESDMCECYQPSDKDGETC